MKRYFSEIAYNGTNYCGWQIQPNGDSVQGRLEEAITTLLRQKTGITGCGRTDSGVHARQYFFHFNCVGDLPQKFLYRINKLLPKDIVMKRVFEVDAGAHARFDAFYRSYEYHIGFQKDPFHIDTIYHYPFSGSLDLGKIQDAAALLLNYKSFTPFCKSNSDVKTMDCLLYHSEWNYQKSQEKLIFNISANRFLRGMVRLIVGMCLNVAQNKLTLQEVAETMQNQSRLKINLSVPPRGLFLTEIKYPFLESS